MPTATMTQSAIEEAFKVAIEAKGITSPPHIIADGKIHRFSTNGKRKDDSGRYVLHVDGVPAGWFMDWRSGVCETWSAGTSHTMTFHERAAYRKRMEAIRAQRDAEEKQRHVEASLRAVEIWDKAKKAPPNHPYLQRKQIKPHGLRVDASNRLIVPIQLVGGMRLSSLQFISPDGDKRFLPGGAVKGGFFPLQREMKSRPIPTPIGVLPKPPAIGIIAEGFATAAALQEATGYPAVCAFTKHNLLNIAQFARETTPKTLHLICGDNDLNGGGQRAAYEAAEICNGLAVIPDEPGTDWNDLHVREGGAAVKRAIQRILSTSGKTRNRREFRPMEKTTELDQKKPSTVSPNEAAPPLQANPSEDPTNEADLVTDKPVTSDTKDRASHYANLLDGVDEPPPPRLPQDFRDGKLSIGVRLKGTAYVVLSDRTILTADQFGAIDYGLESSPMSREGIKRFLNGEHPSGAELITRLEAFVNRFVLLPKDMGLLVAVWIVGTYLYQVFEYFAYLVLRSPEKRCGKTRLLDVIALLAFNAHTPTASPTEAQIFREPREDGGTQIFDELENMTHDHERWKAITGVFNVGFHRGAVVARYKKVGGNQVKELFETYVPRVIASIAALAATLEDRALILFLQRKSPNLHLERFSPRHLSQAAQGYRDACAAFALDRAAAIEACYRTGNFSGLADLDDDRAVNLWEPLIAITSVADAEGGDGTLTDRLLKLAGQIGEERAALAGDEPIVGILEVLRDSLGEEPNRRIPTPDLIGKVKERMGWESLSAKALSTRLHPLGLRPTQWREGKTTVRGYDIEKAKLDEMISRYVPPSKGE